MSLQRAYALLQVRAIDQVTRTFTGTATTPTPDRLGDVVEPRGVKFTNPLPLLLFHDHKRPVGSVKFQKPTDDGITFTANLPEIPTAGSLQDRVAEAWDSVQAGLIKGVSIGFRVLDDGIELLRTGGVRFTKTEVLELSLVSVPANAEAVIDTIKSVDAPHLAASGESGVAPALSGVADPPRRKVRPMATRVSFADRKLAFVSDRTAKVAKLNELMGADDGSTMDVETQQAFDTLTDEVKAIDAQLARIETVETINKASVQPVTVTTVEDGVQARQGMPVVQVRSTLPPGIGFARAVICKMHAYVTHQNPVEIAKERYPSHPEIAAYIKATVTGGTTTDSTWASPLVEPTTLASEFLEYLRPQTIIGKFGLNGVPSLRRVPFNVRIPRSTGAGAGYWVGEGAPKPLTSFAFDDVTVPYYKAAAIAVISQELARFSSPSAETIVRDQLRDAVIARLDTDFIDPAKAISAGVNPASITNGVTALASAGTSADNARTDIQNLVEQFILAHLNVSGLVFIMPNTLALALSSMFTTLGTRQFPDLGVNGGTLHGIPVLTSQYAANTGTYGNLIIAVSANDVALADDGQVSVDVSTEASLQMLDNPTNNIDGTATTMVSMFQTNSLAIRAERTIAWVKLRSTAVQYMDDVNWGSIGSPA